MYQAVDIVTLYLVDVNVKYYLILIHKQRGKCIKSKELMLSIYDK